MLYDSRMAAGGFTDFVKGAGRAIAGGVKAIIPGEIDDAIIDWGLGKLGSGGQPSGGPVPGGLGGSIQPQMLQQPRGCPPGYEKKNGQCVETGVGGAIRRTLPGGRSGTLEDVFGDAVNGRYGVGIVPGERMTSVLDCPEGMVLGKDNICYEHLRNSERKWKKGRKPLLTGGEMNAITKAARAAKRLNRTQKKLKAVGRAIKKVT